MKSNHYTCLKLSAASHVARVGKKRTPRPSHRAASASLCRRAPKTREVSGQRRSHALVPLSRCRRLKAEAASKHLRCSSLKSGRFLPHGPSLFLIHSRRAASPGSAQPRPTTVPSCRISVPPRSDLGEPRGAPTRAQTTPVPPGSLCRASPHTQERWEYEPSQPRQRRAPRARRGGSAAASSSPLRATLGIPLPQGSSLAGPALAIREEGLELTHTDIHPTTRLGGRGMDKTFRERGSDLARRRCRCYLFLKLSFFLFFFFIFSPPFSLEDGELKEGIVTHHGGLVCMLGLIVVKLISTNCV